MQMHNGGFVVAGEDLVCDRIWNLEGTWNLIFGGFDLVDNLEGLVDNYVNLVDNLKDLVDKI